MMQAPTLSKHIIRKSILFTISFWLFTGILMCGLYRLMNMIDVPTIFRELIGLIN